MLTVILCWLVLATSTATIGLAILRLLQAEKVFEDGGDLVVVSMWVGLGTAATVSLAVGLLTAVGPWVGLVFLVAAAGLSRCWAKFCWAPGIHLAIFYALIALVLAFLASNVEIDAYDTGLYQQQAVSWLSRHGLIRGIAWLHFRLGWSSSWFSLAAIFNHGPLSGRVGPILGGFTTVLAMLHWFSKVHCVTSRAAKPADWYLVLVYPTLLLAAWVWHSDISLSPDLATWVMTALVVWVAVLIASSDLPRISSNTPLLLAALGCSYKFSLLPLLPLAILFLLLRRSEARGRRMEIRVAALCLLPVFVATIANVRSSGCPLYPSPVGCIDRDWAVTRSFATAVMLDTRNYARYANAGGIDKADGFSWIQSWVRRKDKAFLLALAMVGATVTLYQWTVRRSWILLWALGVGIAGLAFLFWGAPNPRFGLGFFVMLPALAFSGIIGHRRLKWTGQRGFSSALANVLPVVILCGGTLARIDMSAREARYLIAPERLPNKSGQSIHVFNRANDRRVALQTTAVDQGNLHYTRPVSSDQCWDLPLPCTPERVDARVALSPEGLAGGFVVRQAAAAPLRRESGGEAGE